MPVAACKIKSARLSAQSSVTASSAEYTAHIALTAYADAQRTVYEKLCFNVTAFRYCLYLCK